MVESVPGDTACTGEEEGIPWHDGVHAWGALNEHSFQLRFDRPSAAFERARTAASRGGPQTKTKTATMKHTPLHILPALCLGVLMGGTATAGPIVPLLQKSIAIAEGAMTLNEAAGVVRKAGSFLGTSTRIHVAVQLAEWSRSVSGCEHGARYMHSFEYRHYPVLLNSIYVRRQLVNGVVETDYAPFPVTTLETRDMTCFRRGGPRASWETRRARFAMSARSTVLEKVGLFSDGLGPWPCTVVVSRTPLPSGCTPVADEDTQERRLISVSTGGATYFTFDRSGNYVYGMPEIVLGVSDGARPAPSAPNPARYADALNDPVQRIQLNPSQE